MDNFFNRHRPHLLLGLLCGLTIAGCSPPALYENECGNFLATAQTDAVIPQGMRRTKNGWEDASFWHVAPSLSHQSLDSIVAQQRLREPSWIRSLFAKIRSTPPLMIALIQITAIAAIFHLSQAKKAEQSV